MAVGIASSAAGITLDVAPVADNTLFESATGSLSNGVGEYLFAGRTFQTADVDQRRGVVRFDVAAVVPAGVTISAATLTLNVSLAPDGTPRNFSVHRVTGPWGEAGSNSTVRGGGKGAPAEAGDATWLDASLGTTRWTNPGGDFDATASATTSIGGLGSYTWTGAGLVADVQAWLDGAQPNDGWLLLGDEAERGSARRFDSRENLTAANRPVLSVIYLPEPGSGALLALGLTALAALRSRRAHAD